VTSKIQQGQQHTHTNLFLTKGYPKVPYKIKCHDYQTEENGDFAQ